MVKPMYAKKSKKQNTRKGMSESIEKGIYGFLGVLFVAIVIITCVKLAMRAHPIIQAILDPIRTILIKYGLAQ